MDVSPTSQGTSTKNKDTCIAIAGLPSNNTIAIRKYCIPKAQGKGVRSIATETWYVWYSEEWTGTLVDLKFVDTVSGDVVVVLRDNKGRTLETGPLEHFVSVHPRKIQQDSLMYTALYRTRIMLSSIVGTLDEVAAVASTTPDKAQATIQQQAEDNIMASGIKDWYRRDLCIVFDLNAVV